VQSPVVPLPPATTTSAVPAPVALVARLPAVVPEGHRPDHALGLGRDDLALVVDRLPVLVDGVGEVLVTTRGLGAGSAR